MILADANLWIDFFRTGSRTFAGELDAVQIAMHDFVLGELILGGIPKRGRIAQDILELPRIRAATDAEVRTLITTKKLAGRGIGYVDAHLVAAVLLTDGYKLWTRDARLAAVAADLGIAAQIAP
jgi:predicted nucleic acid-binding protein